MPSKQETLNTIWKHLLEQGRQAYEYSSCGNSLCRYRTVDGRKCAIGCLIPDHKYLPEMEGEPCSSGLIRPILEQQGYDIKVCYNCQIVHDCYKPNVPFRDYINSKLTEVAREHNLLTYH